MKVALDLVSDSSSIIGYCRVNVHVPLRDVLGDNDVNDWPKILGDIHDEIKTILGDINTFEIVNFLDDNSLFVESIALSYYYFTKTDYKENFGRGASEYLDTLKSNVLAAIKDDTTTKESIIDNYHTLCRGRMNIIDTPTSDPIYTSATIDDPQRLLLNKNRQKGVVVASDQRWWVAKIIWKLFKMIVIISTCVFIILKITRC